MKILVKICFALGTIFLSSNTSNAQCYQDVDVKLIVNTYTICQGYGSICALVIEQGVGPYHFVWSNGYSSISNTESCAQNLAPGTYEVNVYDLGQSSCRLTYQGKVPVPNEKDCPEREERRERDER